MGTHSICLYKEVAKQYTSCNPKSTELLDCALIEVCAVIRSNTVLLMCTTRLILACASTWPRASDDSFRLDLVNTEVYTTFYQNIPYC